MKGEEELDFHRPRKQYYSQNGGVCSSALDLQRKPSDYTNSCPEYTKLLKKQKLLEMQKLTVGLFFKLLLFIYYDCVSMMFVNSHVDDFYLFIIVFSDVCEFMHGGHRITFQKLVSSSALSSRL